MEIKNQIDLCTHATLAFEDSNHESLKAVTLAQFFKYRNLFYVQVDHWTHSFTRRKQLKQYIPAYQQALELNLEMAKLQERLLKKDRRFVIFFAKGYQKCLDDRK